MNSKFIKRVAIGSILFPLLALAQADFTTTEGVIAWLYTLSGTAFQIISAIATLAILYSVFLFITAGGEPQTVTKAKQVLIWGLIGIAVSVLANSVPALVRSFLGI